ncbi:MAG: helix-turn-helix domain-containing protein [Solirubrobacteraceae bacterium]
MVTGTLLWERVIESAPQRTLILPDGCVDIVWDGRRLFIAGPDLTARWHDSRAAARYVGLRFSGGTGPALLGTPANEIRDQTPALDELWPSAQARVLTERVAADPMVALQAWAVARAASEQVDPLGPRVLRMAAVGMSVAVMADRLGLSARQLHRRCLPVFGYGPLRLSRVLRMQRTIEQARTGVPLAQVAADCGYADQAHLSHEIRELTGTTPMSLLRELGSR